MGFFVTIKYHPKLEEGKFGYDMEEEEEQSLKVGNKEDEITREELAIAILKQLSRRDILVNEVEAVEFVKKTLKVKESKNGIIIGHKKYTFGDVKDLSSVQIQEINPAPLVQQGPPPPQPHVQPERVNLSTMPVPPQPPQNMIPIKEEFFEPEPAYQQFGQQFQQMGLTIGKRYKVVKEMGMPTVSGGIDVTKYKVINDTGGTVEVPVQHFTATPLGGRLDETDTAQGPPPEIQLSYGGGSGNMGGMPTIRG